MGLGVKFERLQRCHSFPGFRLDVVLRDNHRSSGIRFCRSVSNEKSSYHRLTHVITATLLRQPERGTKSLIVVLFFGNVNLDFCN